MDTTSSTKSISQIKAAARYALVDHVGTTVLASLLFSLIYLLVINLVTPSYNSSFFAVTIQISNLVMQLLTGIFTSGFAYMYLHMVYKNEVRISDLFQGFKNEPNKAILIQCFFVAISVICNLPLLIYEFVYADRLNIFVILLLNLLLPVLSFCLTIPLSQAFFLLQDFPEQKTLSLIRASIRVMQGQKWRYLKLCLSFVPLLVLCSITMFIPLFWLNSYFQTAKAVFFQDLVQVKKSVSKDT